MNAPEEAPHPLARLRIAELRCAAAVSRKQRKAKVSVSRQCATAGKWERRHHGYFGFAQFSKKGVFLQNGRIAPAFRPVELGDQRRAFFHAHLIDAVFVAIERQQAPVGAKADRLDRIQHVIGRERRVGMQIGSRDRRLGHRSSILRRMPLFESLSILVLGALGWLWYDSLTAREAGVREARSACADEGLHLLDDTVAIRRLRLERDDAGRIGLQRTYAFEYSDTGDNRRQGSVTLFGQDVVLVSLRARLTVVGDGHELH